MANPTGYEPEYSFSDYQESNPSDPLPAPQVDNELANISTSITSLKSCVEDVRRSDGAVANGVVTLDALSAAVKVLMGVDNEIDAAISAISVLTPAADKLAYYTGVDTASLTSFTAFARTLLDDSTAAAFLTTLGVSAFIQTLLDDANQAAARTTLGLVPGTDVQAYNANLTTYASIAPSANVQSVLSAANYAAIRTLLGLVIGTDVKAYFAAGQLPGTATNDSASAGNSGEYLESIIAGGSAVSLTSGAAANLTSLSLPAGDWDVDLIPYYSLGATTTIRALVASINTVSGTMNFSAGNCCAIAGNSLVLGDTTTPSSFLTKRISIASTTTIYAVAYADFAVSTCGVFGGLRARRPR